MQICKQRGRGGKRTERLMHFVSHINFIFSLSLTLPPSHLSLSQPHQKPVFLLSVVLALVGAIHDVQLMEGRTVACHLGFQSPPNVLLTLDLLFSFLNDAQNTIQICQLLRTLPEYFCICTHLKEGESTMIMILQIS